MFQAGAVTDRYASPRMQLTLSQPLATYVCIDLYADTSPIIRHPIVEPNGDTLLFGHPLQRVMHVDG